MPVVIWSHGKDAEPWGAKSRRLAESARARGLEFMAPDFTETMDPEIRVDQLAALMTGLDEPPLLAGSSMGGYVSAAAAFRAPCAGLFLVAPAVYMAEIDGFAFARQDFAGLKAPAWVVHGWNDEVVPVANAVRLAADTRATLVVLDADHRFTGAVEDVVQSFERFLDLVLAS